MGTLSSTLDWIRLLRLLPLPLTCACLAVTSYFFLRNHLWIVAFDFSVQTRLSTILFGINYMFCLCFFDLGLRNLSLLSIFFRSCWCYNVPVSGHGLSQGESLIAESFWRVQGPAV